MILVTGINGFVGKHLVRELASRKLEIIGLGQKESSPSPEISKRIKAYHQCDITNSLDVAKLPLENISGAINLAGLANVGASYNNPDLYMEVNQKVLSVLGHELYKKSPQARIIAISTSTVYDPQQSMPLNESSSISQTLSPYAKSKLAMEGVAKEFQAQGFDCVVVRPFNHIGPGQGLGFLIPDLANKLKNTDPNSPEITAGNLKTIRDFSDVRDIAKAYAELATTKTLEHKLYNVCSGQGQSGQDIVKNLCKKLDINYSKLKINTDPDLIRPNDPPQIVGDHSRLTKDTGWQPQIPLSQTVTDIINSLK